MLSKFLPFKISLLFLFVLYGSILAQWDVYPTYDGYLTMMSKFETDYPNLCKIVEFGQSVLDRKLLAAKITDSVDVIEAEPAFLYVSTTQGDATAEFVMMLRLIDYLLSNYGSDPFVSNLVDSVEIWICPLANPDGTYMSGNISQENVQVNNANNKNINRNFPCPCMQGDHQYYGIYTKSEPETKALMGLTDSADFVMSATFHTSQLVLRYPYNGVRQHHADEEWWKYICKEYVRILNENNSLYVFDVPSGYDQGYNVFEAHGTHSDYMSRFKQGRELCGYLCNLKYVDPVNLEPLWDAHYNSFLYYIDQVRYGIQGKVSDALTAAPLNAKVFIENHDKDSSWVYSHLPHGDYYRPVYEGTYDVTFSCDGYHSRTVSGVQVENNKATILDLKLWDISSDIIFQDDNIPVVSIDVYGDRIKINCISNVSNIGHIKLKIVDIYGRILETLNIKANSYTISWDSKRYCSGIYLIKLSVNGSLISRKVTVIR